MSSFTAKKLSFAIYTINNEFDFEKLKLLKNYPVRDITNEPIAQAIFYSEISNDDSNNIDVSNGKVISFSVVVDKKKIPKKKMEKMLEETIGLYIKENKGREPEQIEKDEMKDEIIKVLAKGQHPQRTTCGVIIDLREKVLYVEKKGWLGDHSCAQLNMLCGMEMGLWNPFKQHTINNIPSRTLFLQWLYLSMEKAKMELTVDSELSLSNDIKFFDEDNKITVKGNIIKFIDVYKKMLKNAKVEECTIKIKDERDRDFEYQLKIGDSYIHGFYIKGRPYSGGDDYTVAISRCEELAKFRNHLRGLVRIFEKTM